MRFIGKTFVSAGPAVLALSLACGGGVVYAEHWRWAGYRLK